MEQDHGNVHECAAGCVLCLRRRAGDLSEAQPSALAWCGGVHGSLFLMAAVVCSPLVSFEAGMTGYLFGLVSMSGHVVCITGLN